MNETTENILKKILFILGALETIFACYLMAILHNFTYYVGP